MKKVLTTTLLSLVVGGFLLAQNRTEDEAAINKQVDAMIYSWNNHNYDDLKNYTTENIDWVNVVGMWWQGRRESQYAHQAYHNTFLQKSVAEKKSVALRFVTEDVAIAHVLQHMSGDVTMPDGKKGVPTDVMGTFVYVKQNGKWLLTSGMNVSIDKEAQPYDPVNQMPKN
jgi:uncharacterized protein (TIGR02246 family)